MDDSKRRKEWDVISYEISDVYINDIAKQISSVKRPWHGYNDFGSLLMSYVVGGLVSSQSGNFLGPKRFN